MGQSVSKQKSYPLSHLVIGGLSALSLLISLLVLPRELMGQSLPHIGSPLSYFIINILCDAFYFYLGYLVYRAAKEKWYKRSGVIIAIVSVLSVPFDIINWLYFQMDFWHGPGLAYVSYAIAIVLLVPLILCTYYLLRHCTWPKLQGATRVGFYGMLVAVGLTTLYTIAWLVAVQIYGNDFVLHPSAYNGLPLHTLVVILVFLALFAFLIGGIILLFAYISRHVKPSAKVTPTKWSGLAIASLVLGILAIIPFIGVILGILAIIFGVIAIVLMRKEPKRGFGMAFSGVVLALAGIAFTALLIASVYYVIHQPNTYRQSGESMQHDATFDVWWAENHKDYTALDISKENFTTFPFHEGIIKGHYVTFVTTNYSNVSVGDIVVLNLSGNYPWVTRVMRKYEDNGKSYLIAKGDGNPETIIDPPEYRVPADDVIGVVVKII